MWTLYFRNNCNCYLKRWKLSRNLHPILFTQHVSSSCFRLLDWAQHGYQWICLIPGRLEEQFCINSEVTYVLPILFYDINVLLNYSNWSERPVDKDADVDPLQRSTPDDTEPNSEENMYKEIIFGEDALKIPPSESYCLSHPIRRGHFNISQDYSLHQVLVCDLIIICHFPQAHSVINLQ